MAPRVFRTTLPYNTLTLSAKNVRKGGRNSADYKAGIEVLADSILETGLLQNLVVHMEGETGHVDAGGRRFDAFGVLVARGAIPEDHPIDVLVIGVDDAVSASLTENWMRLAMHPADEFDAFNDLVDQGWTLDSIADSFGVTTLVVERRLKLRGVAPALIEEYRASAITTDQLVALSSTDNHDLQVEVWNNCKHTDWSRHPNNLRKNVLGADVTANDARIGFIGGLSVYEAAGGTVRRDLFLGDGSSVILESPSVLDKLVDEKLADMVEELQSEGWGWVELWRQHDYQAFYRFGEAPASRLEASPAQAEQLAALKKELAGVEAAITKLHEADGDELTDEESAELDALYERQEELPEQIEKVQAQCMAYDPEVMQHCGVLVIYERGEARIHRARVRTADREKVTAALGEGQRIDGGRESEPAGRPKEALSETVRSSLQAHRNLAAQYATMTVPHAAKVLLVCETVSSIRGVVYHSPVDLTRGNGYGARTSNAIADDAGHAKAAEFEAMGKELIAALPTEGDALWDAIAALPAAELDKLLTYSVARSVSLRPGYTGMTGKYLSAIGFDMADHFTPTAENYLGRVPKGLVIDALVEAGQLDADDEVAKAGLLGMKKRDLAQEAERRLAGSRWVPEIIRTPKVEPEAPAKPKPRSRKPTAKA